MSPRFEEMKFMILSKLNRMLTRSIIFRLRWLKGKHNYVFIVIILVRSTLQAFNKFSKSKSLAETDSRYVRRLSWLMGCLKNHAIDKKLYFEI